MTEKRQTSQGCIIRILQHFATKLWNITNFVMLFQAVIKLLSRLAEIKIQSIMQMVHYRGKFFYCQGLPNAISCILDTFYDILKATDFLSQMRALRGYIPPPPTVLKSFKIGPDPHPPRGYPPDNFELKRPSFLFLIGSTK